jgi:hypothetical protein
MDKHSVGKGLGANLFFHPLIYTRMVAGTDNLMKSFGSAYHESVRDANVTEGSRKGRTAFINARNHAS